MNRTLRIALITALAVGGVLALDCVQTPSPPPIESEPRPECPHDARSLPGGPPTITGNISDVPELHDCQRFIVQEHGKLRYTPFFAIYANDSLDTLPFRGRQMPDHGFSYAEVYADSAYGPLGIVGPGYWCLVLQFDGNSQPQWRAKMIDRHLIGNTCKGPIRHPDSILGTELEVQDDDIGEFSPADVPAVARWDWDREHYEQYIGVAGCNGWCEIGDSGFTPSPTYSTDGQFGPKAARRRIKGWYDEQLLAMLPAESPNLVPTRIYGTIFPAPDLGSYSSVAEFDEDRWNLVAYVQLDTVPDAGHTFYKNTYNYDPALHPHDLNEIYLCHGTRLECLGNGASTVQPTCKKPFDQFEAFSSVVTDEWWSKIVAPDGSEKYRCVVYRKIKYNVPHVPGTVRWRWKAWDEGSWDRCPDGCCEVM